MKETTEQLKMMRRCVSLARLTRYTYTYTPLLIRRSFHISIAKNYPPLSPTTRRRRRQELHGDDLNNQEELNRRFEPAAKYVGEAVTNGLLPNLKDSGLYGTIIVGCISSELRFKLPPLILKCEKAGYGG